MLSTIVTNLIISSKGLGIVRLDKSKERQAIVESRPLHDEYSPCADCLKKHGGIDITGTVWSGTSVRRILKYRTYLGQLKFGEEWITGAHEPIIDQATFEKVQEIVKQEYQHPYQHYSRNFLSGLVYCSCGYRMHVTFHPAYVSKKRKKAGKTYWYFSCSQRILDKCSQKSIDMSLVQKEVFSVMDSLLRDESILERVNNAHQRIVKTLAETKPDNKELLKELQETNEILNRLCNAYAQAAMAGLTEDRLQPMVDKMKALEENKEQLELKIKFSGSLSDPRRPMLFDNSNVFLHRHVSMGNMPPKQLTDQQIMDEVFSLWTLLSRIGFKTKAFVRR